MGLGRFRNLLKRPTADATASALMRDVVGHKSDTARTVVGTSRSLMSYLKGLVGNVPQLVAGTTDTSPLASMDLFSITGGPVLVHEIFGIVTTTAVQAQATTVVLSLDPDDAGSDVALNAAYDATGIATGTIIRWTKDVSEALIAYLDVAEATDTQAPGVIMMIGDIKVAYGDTSTGQINWFCLYTSLGGVMAAG